MTEINKPLWQKMQAQHNGEIQKHINEIKRLRQLLNNCDCEVTPETKCASCGDTNNLTRFVGHEAPIFMCEYCVSDMRSEGEI
jgi:hypothetical protein